MTIGALGQATGVGAETIRYYERIGLLAAPARSAAGYRLYTPEHVRRLNFIRRGRELGLSLDAVRELLSLARDRLRPCARIDRLVADHIHAIDHKIAGLNQLRGALQRLADSCEGGHRVAECRILEALQEADQSLVDASDLECEDEACGELRPSPPRSRAGGRTRAS